MIWRRQWPTDLIPSQGPALFDIEIKPVAKNFFQIGGDLRIQKLMIAAYIRFGGENEGVRKVSLAMFNLIHAGPRNEKRNIVVNDEILLNCIIDYG
ncbi:MAG: hypothetical protein L3J67_07795, partial [Hyphomicrobiaceae bacterium]|nr:hypothetical protein [Hyphomicrobiaceae bacterium]